MTVSPTAKVAAAGLPGHNPHRPPSYLTQPKQFLVSVVFRPHAILPSYEQSTSHGQLQGQVRSPAWVLCLPPPPSPHSSE